MIDKHHHHGRKTVSRNKFDAPGPGRFGARPATRNGSPVPNAENVLDLPSGSVARREDSPIATGQYDIKFPIADGGQVSRASLGIDPHHLPSFLSVPTEKSGLGGGWIAESTDPEIQVNGESR